VPSEPTSNDLKAVLKAKASTPASYVFQPASFAHNFYRLLLQSMLDDTAFVIRRGRDSKLARLREGSLSQTTIWDGLLFAHVREDLNLEQIRAVIFEGAIPQARADFFRVTLGVPVASLSSHAFLLAPLSAAMLYDFQALPPPDGGDMGHVGPPGVGIDLKLRGKEEDIKNGRVRGEVRTFLL
jgi:hypothetical protein